MSTYDLRPAVAGDAEQIAVVHHAGWQHAYSDLLPPDFWLTDTVEYRAGRWANRLANGDLVGWPIVATVDGVVVGFAQVGPARTKHGLAPVHETELMSLYLHPDHHGSGVASALLDTCLPGACPADLWTAHPNPRAQAFYSKHGFTRDGAVFIDDHGITEVRMIRS